MKIIGSVPLVGIISMIRDHLIITGKNVNNGYSIILYRVKFKSCLEDLAMSGLNNKSLF